MTNTAKRRALPCRFAETGGPLAAKAASRGTRGAEPLIKSAQAPLRRFDQRSHSSPCPAHGGYYEK